MKMHVVIIQFLLVIQIMTTTSVLGWLAGDTLTPNKTITGRQTLISGGGRFEHGSTGILSLSLGGNLVLMDKSKSIFWTTNTSNSTNPVLRLLDSGNLVLTAGRSDTVLWQSFDHPCDTVISGMKIGVDFKARLVWKITSWKSSTDPSPGDYSYMSETRGVPETFIMRRSTRISRYYGPWDGDTFVDSNGMFELQFVSNKHEVYYFVQLVDATIRARVTLNASGTLQGFLWSEKSNFAFWIFII